MFRGDDTKTLTAHFPRTISIYEGSDVRVLGVPVGTVDTVTPSGTDVVVTMHYDADVQVPDDAKAAIVAPSIVGDRFVQLTPVYTGGDVLADGATLDRGPDRGTARARPDLLEHRRPDRRARPDRRQQGRRAHRPARDHRRQLRRAGREVHTRPSRTSASSARPSTTTRRSSSAPPASSRASSARSPPTTRPSASFNDSLADVSTMLSGERTELVRGARQPRDRARRRSRASSRRTATSSAATSPGSTGSRRSW